MSDSKLSNAFTINSLATRPFPFSAKFSKEDEIQRLLIYPIQIESISIIIEKFSLDFCVVFDVDHYWTDLTLTDVSKEQGLEFKSEDKEIIICEKREFKKLSKNDFSHWNWETFDCSYPPNSELIIQNYVACKDHDWKNEGFLLSKLKDASFYIYSHDDCYLTVESVNKDFLNQILQHNLQTYAITMLAEKNITLNVKGFPSILLNKILDENKVLTILQENSFIELESLVIPFTNIAYHFTEEKQYPITGHIKFDFIKKNWSVEK